VGEYALLCFEKPWIFHQGEPSFSSSIVGLFATNSWVASHLESLLAETPLPTLHVPVPWLPIMPKLVFPKPTPPPSSSALYRRRASRRWSGSKPSLCGFGTSSVFLDFGVVIFGCTSFGIGSFGITCILPPCFFVSVALLFPLALPLALALSLLLDIGIKRRSYDQNIVTSFSRQVINT
jgi:hypothetical protein